MRLVAAFFGDIKGFFVEVGANDPHERSQTWHLEQAGWTGVLVEPQPDLAGKLRADAQGQGLRGRLFVAGQCRPVRCRCMSRVRCRRSTASAWRRAPTPETVIEVPVRTLDNILDEAQAPAADSIFCRSMSKAMSSKCCAASISRAGGRG